MSENSSIDVSATSEYVIRISCTDGTDTTFFNLTLLFTTNTDKPKTQADTILIIISASIGGLFLLVVVLVIVCVRKRQNKKNDENRVNKTVQLSPHIGGSSDGVIPNQYSNVEKLDVISYDDCEYAEVQ